MHFKIVFLDCSSYRNLNVTLHLTFRSFDLVILELCQTLTRWNTAEFWCKLLVHWEPGPRCGGSWGSGCQWHCHCQQPHERSRGRQGCLSQLCWWTCLLRGRSARSSRQSPGAAVIIHLQGVYRKLALGDCCLRYSVLFCYFITKLIWFSLEYFLRIFLLHET